MDLFSVKSHHSCTAMRTVPGSSKLPLTEDATGLVETHAESIWVVVTEWTGGTVGPSSLCWLSNMLVAECGDGTSIQTSTMKPSHRWSMVGLLYFSLLWIQHELSQIEPFFLFPTTCQVAVECWCFLTEKYSFILCSLKWGSLGF